ncbi:MAG: right-handed parallel beta-helix repeat-containing protein, partial [Paludibacteraceae bacterium]|nr:right-handed parallel beta-helix repeat-containing protein [Paludibacteraceae bacterium]
MNKYLLPILLGCFIINANAIDFHVSPNGNDAAEGTLTAPFKTLERAQSAVRGVNKSMSEDINVYLHEGTYQLASTLRLSNADGGTNGHYVRYMAAPGETPLVTGGVPVNGWEIFDADKNIWCVKDVVNRFRQLYVNGKKAIRARHPNVKPNGDHYFNRLAKVDTFGRAFDVYTDQIKKLENIKRSEIHVMVAWADQILRIEDVKYNGNTCKIIPQDPERTRLFRRAYPMLGTAFMSNPPKQQCYYLENDMSLLDMQGEWFLDEDSNTLYYIPREGEDMTVANVVAPNLETLIEVTGESTRNKVQNISFSGIVFAHTNFLRPSREGLLNLQAGQFAVKVEDRGYLKSNEFMLWHPEAGIEVTNASRVIFEDNIFTQMAATGLDFTSGTNDTRIEGNVFTEIGGSSISIGKFAPDSLTEIHKGYNPSDKDEICTRDTVKN